MKTTVLLDHEPVADGGWMVHALLRLEGEATPEGERPPLNLSLVLDRSGSMAGEKLHAARRAAAMLVRRLAPGDTVSVVAFDDDVTVIAPPAAGPDQEHLPSLVEGIEAGSSTNLSGGWLRGRDLVHAHLRDGGVNRVLLLTDGQANLGITDHALLVGLCRHAATAGVSTTTVGFGRDFDEDLLRAMADAGQGGTYYIEEADQATGVFEEELEGLLSIAAQNVRVTVRPGAGADSVKVLHQYPSHAAGEVLTLEVGDLYAREPRRILVAFLLRPGRSDAAGPEVEVGRLGVTAHVLGADGGVELHEIDIPLTLTPTEGGKAEPAVRKEILLVAAARLREEALAARDRGDFASAAHGLSAFRQQAGDLSADAEVAEEIHDLESMASAFEAREVGEADVKYLKQRAYSGHRSRRESLGRYRRE